MSASTSSLPRLRSDTLKQPDTVSGCSSRSLKRTASVRSLNSAFSHLSSSTMTASDLPGPGRILDKYVFTKGGRALERAIARLAHSLGFGPAAAALRIGANLRGFSLDEPPPSMALTTCEGATPKTLRLDLGLVWDIPRLVADCRRLVDYTRSYLLSTRIQAFNMIITLYIKFPYLSLYFDSAEVAEHMRSRVPSCHATEADLLEDSLARMAFACLAPVDNLSSVTRLVDHLAERTKRAEEQRRAMSTGPWYILLPNTQMIRKYCEDARTSFAALRFTGIVFRHSFLSRGEEFYVKLNSATMTGFWRDLTECIRNLVQAELARPCGCSCLKHCLSETDPKCAHLNRLDIISVDPDLEGIDLFSETVFEMLYRAAAWDPLLQQMEGNVVPLRDSLIRDAIEILRRPMAQTLFPNASFIALAKLEPQAELLLVGRQDYSYTEKEFDSDE